MIDDNYNVSPKRWIYPSSVINTIIKEIDLFYDSYNKDKSGSNKQVTFNNEPAFAPLQEHIKLKSGFDRSDIPQLGWLQDLYNGLKHNKKISTINFESLLASFEYSYNYKGECLIKIERPSDITEDERIIKEKLGIIELINSKSRKSVQLKEFVGKYKYFVGARKHNTIYDYIYENDLEIFKNGHVEIINPFNKHVYFGIAIITTNSSLQIISYDFDSGVIDGIGNVMTFDVNRYGRMVMLIPGIGLTFDSDGRPIATQTMLCTDTSKTVKDNLIREYFDTLASELRLYCPKITDVEKLVVKHHNLK